MLMIPLFDAIRAMRQLDERGKPIPFDLMVVKLDKRRGTAGGKKVLTNQILMRVPKPSIAKEHKKKLSNIINEKNPNHRINRTLNLYDRITSRRTKVKVRLIVMFNNQRVIY